MGAEAVRHTAEADGLPLGFTSGVSGAEVGLEDPTIRSFLFSGTLSGPPPLFQSSKRPSAYRYSWTVFVPTG